MKSGNLENCSINKLKGLSIHWEKELNLIKYLLIKESKNIMNPVKIKTNKSVNNLNILCRN